MVALVAGLEQGRIDSAKLALKNKLGFGYRLPQLFCGTKRLPLEWKANDEGAAVNPGRDSMYLLRGILV
jgi:hypothetical protein